MMTGLVRKYWIFALSASAVGLSAFFGCVDRAVVGDFAPDGGSDSATTEPDAGGGEVGNEASTEFRVPPVRTRIAASRWATCGITSTNGVLCWGDNSGSQLGFDDFSHSPSRDPVAPPGLPQNAFAVARGQTAHCALLEGEPPRCWGSVGFGLAEDTGRLLLTEIDHPTPLGPLANDIAKQVARLGPLLLPKPVRRGCTRTGTW